MKKEDVDKAAKEEVENTVFYNICTEEIDNEESNYEAGRRDALDVYKRQNMNIALWCNGCTTDFGSVGHGSSPVSYTHLDVYKRQCYYS